jgi:hypothetical protein
MFQKTGRLIISSDTMKIAYKGRYYLDFTTICEICSGNIGKTKLFELLKKIEGIEQNKVNYKNRIFYEEGFVLINLRYYILEFN